VTVRTLLAFVLAECAMILGYFTFETFWFGSELTGFLNMAIGELPQAATGVAGGYILLFGLERSGFFKRNR
jgi:hypothetical protein